MSGIRLYWCALMGARVCGIYRIFLDVYGSTVVISCE